MHKETKKDENKTEREKKGKERAFFSPLHFGKKAWERNLLTETEIVKFVGFLHTHTNKAFFIMQMIFD